MCTLTVILGESARYPLVVAANRDEFLGRPTREPFLWADRSPRIVAGRDELAGGTWMGFSERGLFAGLTNLWAGREPDRDRESRGAVVLELLESEDLDAARARLAARDPRRTNPFLCVCARPGEGALVAHSDDGLNPRQIEPGFHAFGNQPPESEPPKLIEAAASIRAAWESRDSDEPDDVVAALRPALARHQGDKRPQESICVHGGNGYGTVSSSILLLGSDYESGAYYHAAGPPCTTEFADRSELLVALFDGPRIRPAG